MMTQLPRPVILKLEVAAGAPARYPVHEKACRAAAKSLPDDAIAQLHVHAVVRLGKLVVVAYRFPEISPWSSVTPGRSWSGPRGPR